MSRKPTKYVFVTGGVVSSIGKGLASAAVGALLEGRGLRITTVKLDPYINVDPGTMSPYQHGEVLRSGRPGRFPSPAPHGSGRARLTHPALRNTGSLRAGCESRRQQRVAPQQSVHRLPGEATL